MKKTLVVMAAMCCSSLGLWAGSAQEELQNSADVMHEIMATPEKGIPQDLLNKAYCVIVVPSLKKAAFVVGGEYGKGVAVCRRSPGMGWGAPAFVKVEGGSFGFQIGGSATDVVMLVMNDSGMQKLERDKITLGADASIAAGPVGRTASAKTDVEMNAEILSWSRSKGLFAGIALNGATIRPDKEDNKEIYGRPLGNREILMSNMQPTAAAHPLIAELDRYSMRKDSNADRSR